MPAKKKKKSRAREAPKAAEPLELSEPRAAEHEAPAESKAPAPKSWWEEHFHFVIGMVLPTALLFHAMARVWSFTVDDSYISFRYARNFARGMGLVYNEGERVEGYTNFLWTVLLGIGIKLGADPVILAKLLGGACATGSLYLLYRLSNRLRSLTTVPAIAPTLFATSILNTGYTVFGLEGALFVVLILGGTYLFLREEPAFGDSELLTTRLPYSGLLFGLAGITRPEAPMYIGILALFLGRKIISKRNIVRGALFVGVVGAHLLFRHSYYGSWTPNTLSAKTGNFDAQFHGGLAYFWDYCKHEGPLLLIAFAGIGWGAFGRRRDILAISAIALAVPAYVIAVGGDWMPYFRFLVPFEPFAFLLIDIATREGWDRGRANARIKAWVPGVIVGIAVALTGFRMYELRIAQRFIIREPDRFWRMAAGNTAKWFLAHERATIAMGDIGYVGYATDYPLLDLLGLVDPVIGKLPGGYTQKVGKGFIERIIEVNPRYLLLVSSTSDCRTPSTLGSQIMYADPRIRIRWKYDDHSGGKVPLDGDFAWCIYENKYGH
jgi:hypothetical protein